MLCLCTMKNGENATKTKHRTSKTFIHNNSDPTFQTHVLYHPCYLLELDIFILHQMTNITSNANATSDSNSKSSNSTSAHGNGNGNGFGHIPFHDIVVDVRKLLRNYTSEPNKPIEVVPLKELFLELCAQLYFPVVDSICDSQRRQDCTSNSLDITTSNVIIEPLTGGITNNLFKVSFRLSNDQTISPCIIRCFGPKTETIINRKLELVVADYCSSMGFGVKIYGIFQNGRVEQFREVHTLQPQEMKLPVQMQGIAKKLVEFHHLPFDNPDLFSQLASYSSSSDVVTHPLSATFKRLNNNSCSFTSPLFNILPQYLEKVRQLAQDTPSHTTRNSGPVALKVKFLQLLDFWEAELSGSLDLLAHCKFVYEDNNYGLCHNDLLSGNILVDEKQHETISNYCASKAENAEKMESPSSSSSFSNTDMIVIDYEYSDWNLVAYDIANHFCEMCGFDCNWESFPSTEQQDSFISTYLSHHPSNNPLSLDSSSTTIPISHSDLLSQTQSMIIFSHLFWGIWALIQSRESTIDFDYLHYSMLRKEGYLIWRDKCWQMLKSFAR